MIKVLMVCLGNICRSPMAEAVFQAQVQQAGLSANIMVDSAGTGGWHVGETAHKGTLAILKEHNIAYDGRARQFVRRDLTDFDYVLAMDAENFSSISAYLGDEPQNEVKLFLSYANAAKLTSVNEVPDPYYDGRFPAVYELVTVGSQALLEYIRKKHNL